jgi:hypothetical protein
MRKYVAKYVAVDGSESMYKNASSEEKLLGKGQYLTFTTLRRITFDGSEWLFGMDFSLLEGGKLPL